MRASLRCRIGSLGVLETLEQGGVADAKAGLREGCKELVAATMGLHILI